MPEAGPPRTTCRTHSRARRGVAGIGRGVWQRLRRDHRGLDHLARATERYLKRSAYHYAGGITYFTLLSLVPLMMIVFSAAGFVLAGNPTLLDELRTTVAATVPLPVAPQVVAILDRAIADRGRVGAFGAAIALYCGWAWIAALRDALTAMWNADRPVHRLIPMVLKDYLALLGLVSALLVSFALTTIGTAFGAVVIRVLGLLDSPFTHGVIVGLSLVLSLVADWITFVWVLARLPREPVRLRLAARAAIATSLGFEALKLLAGSYLSAIQDSVVLAAFGSVLGLFIFTYLVARMLLFVAAWMATAK